MLVGFMIKIPCPKCGNRSTHLSYPRHPWMAGTIDEVLSCTVCGTRVYGPERVDALRVAETARLKAIEDERDAVLIAARKAEEAEKRRQKKELERVAAEAAKAEAARKKAAYLAAMEADIYARAKCRWASCPNDHTTTSLYCSRTCSNKNAHAREKAKQLAAKAAKDAKAARG